MDVDEIIAGLLPAEIAYLSCRVGFPAADFDLLRSDLIGAGFLNADGSFTDLGKRIQSKLRSAPNDSQ